MNKKIQRLNLKNIGKNVEIHKLSDIKCKILKIGDNVIIEKGVKLTGEKITIDSGYVKENIGELVKDTDLSKFIL